MAKTVDLLLTETVETLGIVGDVVSVKPGYARNYLLPRQLATEPTEEKIQALAAKRAEAEKEMARIRAEREGMIGRLEGHELTIERSCNDQGLLYGSVTQKDIAEALSDDGFDVRVRDVRLGQTIKRIDSYDVLVKPDNDLEATIKLWVVSDRKLDLEPKEEPEFDEEGNLIEKPAAAAEAPPPPAGEGEQADEEPSTRAEPGGEAG